MVDLVRKYPNGKRDGIAPATGAIGETIINSVAVVGTVSSATPNTYTAITNANITIPPGVWLINWSAAYTSGDHGVIGVSDDGAITGMLSRSNKTTGIVASANTIGATIPYNNSTSKTLTLFVKSKSASAVTVLTDNAIASVLTDDGTTHIMATRIA